MANNTEEKKEFTTALTEWNKSVTGLVTKEFQTVGVPFDEYAKTCAMNAMTSIYTLVNSTDKTALKSMDMSNLREVVGQAASLRLNANMKECYFQVRNKKVGNGYVKVVEMNIEGDGYDALLRQFGENVERVYPYWVVNDGDEFTYPKRKGLKMDAPEWTPMGLSSKAVRVVYPVLLKDGTEEYLIAERDSVNVNLMAHIRQNLLNATFGICENVYKATAKQKEQIKAEKDKVFDALRACETVDDMLSCDIAKPFISPAWLDTPESMIIRKMRNNATRKFPKNMNALATRSMLEVNEVYRVRKEEEELEANSEEFVAEEVVDAEAELVAEEDAAE